MTYITPDYIMQAVLTVLNNRARGEAIADLVKETVDVVINVDGRIITALAVSTSSQDRDTTC